MSLAETLLKKAAEDKLGHFYIVETSAPTHDAFPLLVSFVHQFIKDYYQKIELHKQSLTHLMDHPDVYVLGKITADDDEKTDKVFKVEDAEALSRFFEFKAVQGKRKFAVITEAHKIGLSVANKWLKLFEEPQGTSTIFLLNPQGGQLLPTIHSRAIHLRLKATPQEAQDSDWKAFLADVKAMPLSEILERYSRGEQDLSYWVNHLIRWEATQSSDAASKEALAAWLRTYQEMETFHQLAATKWTLFTVHLKDHVLPRLSR